MRILALLLILFTTLSLQANTIVRFTTFYGSWDVELFDDEKPITVTNFLSYIERGEYTNMFMHRLDDGFVVQGGGFAVTNRQIAPIATHGQIFNEYSVGPRYSNVYGTIAMARSSGVNSATSQFFMNLSDGNNFLDNVNGGFTVFGRTISGTNVLNRFVTLDPVTGPWIVNANPPGQDGPLGELPVTKQNPTLDDLLFTKIEIIRRHQRITFPTIGTKNFADGSFPLVATSSSGLTNNFEVVSGPGFISEGKVMITGAGSIVVRASNPGNATYSPASAQQTVIVEKASQQITFAPIGDQLLSSGSVPLNITTVARLAPTITVVEGPVTISNRVAIFTNGLGQVTIRVSQSGNANYHPAPDVQQTFQIKGTVNLTGSAGGTVMKSPDLPSYTNQTSLTIMAHPQAGFVFTGWTGDITGAETPKTIIVTTNLNIHAEFRTTAAAPPRLTALEYTAGRFTLRLDGQPNTTYELQTSTTLTNWTTLKTGTNPSGQVIITDENATNRFQFYRVLQPRP